MKREPNANKIFTFAFLSREMLSELLQSCIFKMLEKRVSLFPALFCLELETIFPVSVYSSGRWQKARMIFLCYSDVTVNQLQEHNKPWQQRPVGLQEIPVYPIYLSFTHKSTYTIIFIGQWKLCIMTLMPC